MQNQADGPPSHSPGHFQRDRRGATSIEYALIVALVFLAVVSGVRAFSTESGEMYDEISSAVVKG
ncbi:MAG: Flp family type IVb pilin [Alphaproteobacteria bacterium]|nr:Flp family type IVb pilin [Alphaproteobacteria bacterium]